MMIIYLLLIFNFFLIYRSKCWTSSSILYYLVFLENFIHPVVDWVAFAAILIYILLNGVSQGEHHLSWYLVKQSCAMIVIGKINASLVAFWLNIRVFSKLLCSLSLSLSLSLYIYVCVNHYALKTYYAD